MRPICLFLAGLIAQPTCLMAESPSGDPLHFGMQVQMGYPLGSLNRDLNQHLGFGVALTAPLGLGSNAMLRPILEFNGYRVSRYDLGAWLNSRDDKDLFRTQRLGLELQLHQRPWWEEGPYIFVGVGGQHSKVDWTIQYEDQRETVDTRLEHSGLWYGAGFGYQFGPTGYLEIRYSSAPYAAQEGLPLEDLRRTQTLIRQGQFIHLILGAKFH